MVSKCSKNRLDDVFVAAIRKGEIAMLCTGGCVLMSDSSPLYFEILPKKRYHFVGNHWKLPHNELQQKRKA